MMRSVRSLRNTALAMARAAPAWLARLAVLAAFLLGLALIAWLVLDPGQVLGPVVETLPLDDGRLLVRVALPGLASQAVILHGEAATAVTAGETWLLARGVPLEIGGGAALDAREAALLPLPFEEAEAFLLQVDAAGWALVATGFGLVLFGRFALRLVAAASLALLVAALAWHALQVARFEELLTLAARLEPVWLGAGLLLGGALGVRAAFDGAPAAMHRFGAVDAALALAPVLAVTHPFGASLASLLPVLGLLVPALATGIAAGLAVQHGLDLPSSAAPWIALGGIAAAIAVDRLQPDLDPLPMAHPETAEDAALEHRLHARARRLGDWIRGGLS